MRRIKDIAWHHEYDDALSPFCPYCNEFAYEKDHCVFCGKKYRWVDNESANSIIVEQDGYTAVQCGNGHIHIYKDERWVYHESCTEKKTEDELREQIRFLKELRDEK